MFKRSIHTASVLRNAASSSSKASSFGSVKKILDTANDMNKSQSERVIIDSRFIPEFYSKTTYDPFDFSISSQRYQSKVYKTKEAKVMKSSSFNAPEINPIDFYTLPHLLSNYMNSSGQILHRSVTGLAPKKQKQVAKAIRRARSFGLLSSVAKDVSTFTKRGSTL